MTVLVLLLPNYQFCQIMNSKRQGKSWSRGTNRRLPLVVNVTPSKIVHEATGQHKEEKGLQRFCVTNVTRLLLACFVAIVS